MRARPTAILVVLIGMLGVAFALPLSAAAAAAPLAAPTALDLGPSIRGTLQDETNPQDPQPVEGVEVTVLDEAGESEIGTATSDAEGQFNIPVPEPGNYTVSINTDTLPEGTTLRNPDQVELTVDVTTDLGVTVQFPIGPDDREVTGLGETTVGLVTNGLLFGVVLALAALGLSMIFGTTGLTNFAHGELVAFGAIVTYVINRFVGLPVILSGVLAVILAGLFGFAQDKGLWGQLRSRGTGLIAMMIVSIGLAIFLRGLYLYLVGGNRYAYTDYVTSRPWELGPIQITPRDLAIMVVAIAVLVAVSYALMVTRLGKAMRAVADNPPLAASSGINVDGVIAMVWTGGAALAGLGGFLYALKFQLDYEMGLRLLLLIFAAVVLGGLGTIWGALVGAVIVGLVTELSTLIIPAELKYVGALSLLIVILLVRPQGLLGRAQRVG